MTLLAPDTDRDIALSDLSDTFKEINGWRPRGMYDLDNMTLEDIYAETDRLHNAKAERQLAKERQKAAIAARETAAFEATPLTYNPFASILQK